MGASQAFLKAGGTPGPASQPHPMVSTGPRGQMAIAQALAMAVIWPDEL